MGHNVYFSEGSDSYTVYNSPASSCFEDYNVAAEVEMWVFGGSSFICGHSWLRC